MDVDVGGGGREWAIHFWDGRLIEAGVFRIGHDADDGFGRFRELVDLLADGVFVGEERFDEGLVDDGGVGRVGGGEQAAFQQWDAEGFEIAWGDVAVGHVVAAEKRGGKRAAFARKRVPVDAPSGREPIAEGDGGDAGDRGQMAADIVDGSRGGDGRAEDVFGLEAHVLVLESPQAFKEQRGHDQEREGQSDFGGDEKGAGAGAGETTGRLGRGERGGEAEDDSRGERCDQRESQDAEVDRDLGDARKIGWREGF